MIEQTGESYQIGKYAKATAVAEAKVGKSCFLIASALGLLPWQKEGGIVDDPRNLHVIALDSNALGGVKRFLKETCGAPDEALQFRVYNLQDDLRKVGASETEYDMDLYNATMQAITMAQDRMKGSGLLLISSLTSLAQGLLSSIAGPVKLNANGKMSGTGMDQNKWGALAQQINRLRNFAQQDSWHCVWEAHIYKPPTVGDQPSKETLQISGSSGHNFLNNVDQVFRIRRMFNQVVPGTRCDQVYLDTRPSLDFIAGGRAFTEALDAKEIDPTIAFRKLGLTVGGWGAKTKVVATNKTVVKQAVQPKQP